MDPINKELLRLVWELSPFNPDYEANTAEFERKRAEDRRKHRIAELKEELRYLENGF